MPASLACSSYGAAALGIDAVALPNCSGAAIFGRIAWGWLAVAAGSAHAQDEGGLETITVTANRPSAGAQVAPDTGVTSYTADQAQIETVPGGDSAAFQQVLLRMPGVVQDSYGEVHIRGEHGNAGYRIDGVMLPEGLEGFGQEFDTHFIASATLLTGALPAQYGLRLSGVVDITTKSGADLNGGEAGVYGGSFGKVRPYLDYGRSAGNLDYFVSLSDLRDGLGIENPTPSTNALHDETNQAKGFGSVRYRIDDGNSLSFLWGVNQSRFQIPDTSGETPSFGLAGAAPIPSAQLNENQSEEDDFAVLAYRLKRDAVSLQASVFYHYNRILFVPDAAGDLLYQGVASRTSNLLQSGGTAIDASYAPNDRHTFRFGGQTTLEGYDRRNSTLVFPAANGTQLSDVPMTINDADAATGVLFSLYAQDAWRVAPRLTINYGLRYDLSHGFTDASQASPRINAVYELTDDVTAHLGYARTFTPSGLEFISAANVARFGRHDQRPHSLHAGCALSRARELFRHRRPVAAHGGADLDRGRFPQTVESGIDLGQFGDAVILTPFNYGHGHTYGVETSARVSQGPWRIGLNFSWVRATAVGLTSAQAEFPAAELAYIDTHWIVLDHDQPYTVSLDSSYALDEDTRLFADCLYGSGLRYGFANEGILPPHYQINFGIEHVIPVAQSGITAIKLRFDGTNLLDQRAELRAGTGVGIAAPQFLPPRGFFGTVAVEF